MSVDVLDELAELLEQHTPALLERWREQVRKLNSARGLDVPTLNDHIPLLLEELVAALESKSDESIADAVNAESSTVDGRCDVPSGFAATSPPAHGLQRLQTGFDIDEVVAEYNMLRGCIHDLACEHGLVLQGRPFHIINRVLDHAIGLALQTYATESALEVQRRREEYLSFVAHDLRTPLSAISLAGRVLEMTLPGSAAADATTSQMLKALRRNVQQLEALVSKVLEENANLQTELGLKLERRTFDLWPLVESLTHDLHPVAGTSSTRLVNAVPDDLVVFADAGLLRRVFQNLIANAIKYTPRGLVTIRACELASDGQIECTVTDDGAGISPDLIEKVFDKGETDPESAGGSGLGLAIVKTFVEAHGGTVSVESQAGVGSKFRFLLPTKKTVEARAKV